jgi:ArsR family metal-binding transcriptional regulator
VSEQVGGVVETLEDLDPRAVFSAHRDQVILAVRITPIFNTLDLSLVTAVVDAANQAGFALVREHSLRDEWLLCVFDAYDEHD